MLKIQGKRKKLIFLTRVVRYKWNNLIKSKKVAKLSRKEKGLKLIWMIKNNNIHLIKNQSYLLMQRTAHIKWLEEGRKVHLKRIRHKQAQKSVYKVIIVKRKYQMMLKEITMSMAKYSMNIISITNIMRMIKKQN